MFMPKGGGESGAKMDKIPVPDFEGIKLEPFDGEEYANSLGDVAALGWDALNSTEFKISKGERIDDIKDLFPKSLNTNNHLKLYVLRGEYGIDGFVAMNVDSEKRVGTLTHVWLSEKRHQAGELAEILESSRMKLRAFGCDRGVIKAPDALPTLERVGSRTEPSNFWTFQSGEDEGPQIVGESRSV